MFRILICVVVLMVLGVFSPVVIVAILSFLLLVQSALLILPLLTSAASKRQHAPAKRQLSLYPKFSIHIATHNEPSDMVISTLKCTLSQNYPSDRFEVLVLDNNTMDTSVWHPVQRFCEASQSTVEMKFYHDMGVVGAKAGALQLGLSRMSSEADYVVTLDADYCVSPDFLNRVVANLHKTGADYLQFPQAYHSLTPADQHLQRDYRSYFSVFCKQANTCQAALPTGTLTVINKTALLACGMWGSQSITEDAELGIRLQLHGYRGHFCDEVVGHGLLPLTLDGFLKQRYRWSLGNMEAISANVDLIGSSYRSVLSRFDGMRVAHVVGQLFAWQCFGLIGALILPLSLFFYQLSDNASYLIIANLSSLVIVLASLRQSLPIVLCSMLNKTSALDTLTTLLIRAGAAPTQSIGTLAGMLSLKTTFFRTPKCPSLSVSMPSFFLYDQVMLIAALVGLVFGYHFENILVIAASLLMLLPMFGKVVLTRCINSYNQSAINGVSHA